MLCLRRHSHRARWSTSSSRAAIQTLKSFGTFPDRHSASGILIVLLDISHYSSVYPNFNSELTIMPPSRRPLTTTHIVYRRQQQHDLSSHTARPPPVSTSRIASLSDPASISHLHPDLYLHLVAVPICSSAPSVQASHLPCPLLLLYVYSRRLLVVSVSVPLSDCLVAEIEMLLPRSPSIKRRPASVESAPPPPCQLHAPFSRPIHDVT